MQKALTCSRLTYTTLHMTKLVQVLKQEGNCAMKKKLLVFAICIITLCSTAKAAQTFADVPSDYWAQSYINQMTSEGVLSGYSDGNFYPENTMTRGEFSTVLAKIMGLQLTDADSTYVDVNAHWAKQYIVAVTPYIGGITDDLFEPDLPVTREVVVGALGQIQGWAISNIETSAVRSMFSDFNEITPKLQDGVIRAVNLGITTGYPLGSSRTAAEMYRSPT